MVSGTSLLAPQLSLSYCDYRYSVLLTDKVCFKTSLDSICFVLAWINSEIGQLDYLKRYMKWKIWFEENHLIGIGNSMIFNAIWKKTRTSEFFKDLKIARVRRTCAVWGFWKTHKCVFFQIARETMLLLINNIHDIIMQNWVTRLRHVQNNLLTFDCSFFHSEKIRSQ